MKHICVMEIGDIEESVVNHITEGIKSVIGFPVKRIRIEVKMVEDAYSFERNQFLASKILRKMSDYAPEDCYKTLGIVDVDIYTPIFTFIFGQSQFGGRFSIISLYRLKQNFYSLPEDKELLKKRAVKEAIHELGHNFGLSHCDDPFCVMHFSSDVSKIDRKGRNFCINCRKFLNTKIKEEGKNGK